MQAIIQAILIILTFSGLHSAFAAHLRHYRESLSSLSHSSSVEFFKVPLKKRVIDLHEMNEFQQLVSLWQRGPIRAQDSYDTTSYIDSELIRTEEVGELNSSISKIKLSRYQNTQYTGIISIGNSAEEFEVIFDTGSANMWINSKLCSFPHCVENKQYDATKSNTFEKLGKPLEVQFGSGSLVGEINADNVWLGDIKIEKQPFAMIREEYGASFMSTKLDGIVGLAFPKMSAYSLNPLFDNIIEQKKLKKNMFSFYFDRRDEARQKSHLMIGGIDKSLIDGEIMYFPVVDQYYWTIEASAILVDGMDIGLCENGCRLIADSGTSLITSPNKDFINLMSYLPQESDSSSGCHTQNLPDITFVLKNGFIDPSDKAKIREMKFTITPEDYVVNLKTPERQKKCVPGIVPLEIAEPHGPAWILGETFLSKFISAYDRDNDAVGFARAKFT